MIHPCDMVQWSILITRKNILLHKYHKSSVPQNREYKSTLPRVVDECFTSNDGVSMFNAHKLNITKNRTKKEITLNWITKSTWMWWYFQLTSLINDYEHNDIFNWLNMWMTLGMQTQLSIPFNNQDWSTPKASRSLENSL